LQVRIKTVIVWNHRRQYLKFVRVVNGYGEFDYSEIVVVVRVNQKESGSCRDPLNMALLKNE